MIDLSTLTDEELDEQRVAILTEQERREKMVAIPSQVKDLADQYEAGGGDRQELVDALAPDPEEPVPAL